MVNLGTTSGYLFVSRQIRLVARHDPKGHSANLEALSFQSSGTAVVKTCSEALQPSLARPKPIIAFHAFGVLG